MHKNENNKFHLLLLLLVLINRSKEQLIVRVPNLIVLSWLPTCHSGHNKFQEAPEANSTKQGVAPPSRDAIVLIERILMMHIVVLSVENDAPLLQRGDHWR